MIPLKPLYRERHSQIHGIFNLICVLAMLSLFYTHKNFPWIPFLRNDNVGEGFHFYMIHHRKMVQLNPNSSNSNPTACDGLFKHEGYSNKCQFLIANPGCHSGGFFNYIAFLYCDCKNVSFLGYAVLFVWLCTLFYLLGNTAADYFCCSLEKLSNILKLPPTVAGVTLLPFGNGAPDVFSSIVAFMGEDAGEVGLNSVLGGALFVACVVVGIISISVSDRRVQIDKKCFVRDILFFLIAILSLGILLVDGKVIVGDAVAFISIYIVYAFLVFACEVLRKQAEKLKFDEVMPLLPERGSFFSHHSEESEEYMHILTRENSDHSHGGTPRLQNKVPSWMWSSNVMIFSTHSLKDSPEGPKFVWGWIDDETEESNSCCSYVKLLLDVPLTLPRRLTIPLVEEDRWSKGYAVASAALSPILLAFLWNTHDGLASFSYKKIGHIIGVASGCVLGILACFSTKSDQPPQRFLFPWVFGGFIMSIVWFYIIANELVSLLLAFGIILGINPSLLGITVLAWGNSMGDLVSNVTMALNGQDGVQFAMSGCYASPMFNTLAGLGISLLLESWSQRPEPFIVPKDSSLFYTMGFLFLALVWTLIILPRNNMCPNKMMGTGLILIYLVFLFSRIATSMNVLSN